MFCEHRDVTIISAINAAIFKILTYSDQLSSEYDISSPIARAHTGKLKQRSKMEQKHIDDAR
ncbi:hypothetical protein CHS0354_031948, partial [Potamilus streckersoni]